MTGEAVYEISRFARGVAMESGAKPIERFALAGPDFAGRIAADRELNEVRADQLTRITATPEIAALLPTVLTAPDQSGHSCTLYVNGERWAAFPGADGRNHLLPMHAGNPPTVALARPWLRLHFAEAAIESTAELGLATPVLAVGAGNGTAPVRVWLRDSRDTTPRTDAQIVLSWLQANALCDLLGVDADLLVQLFIESAVDPTTQALDGELLADLAGVGNPAGTTPGSQWRLMVSLAPDVVPATLDAIADSSAQRRYAIIAARDPESPAGRVRRTILADRAGG